MRIFLNGKVVVEPKCINIFENGDKLYECYIENKRTSGKIDTLRVTYINNDIHKDYFIDIIGDVRSIKLKDKESCVFVHARHIDIIDVLEKLEDYRNIIIDKGVVSRDIVFRTTFSGLPIADMYVKVNRNNNKFSYIYCSVWSDNIDKCKDLKVGDIVDIVGRLHSRKINGNFISEVLVMKLRKGDNTIVEGSNKERWKDSEVLTTKD